MEKDSGQALSELAVDGGMSNSDLTMQVCSYHHHHHYPAQTNSTRLRQI